MQLCHDAMHHTGPGTRRVRPLMHKFASTLSKLSSLVLRPTFFSTSITPQELSLLSETMYPKHYCSHMGIGTGGATGARAPPVFELTYEVVQRVSSKSVAVPTSLSTLSCHQLIKISKFYSNNLMLDL